MNKLRFIKIYEIRGNIHPIEAHFLRILDGMVEDNYNGMISYKKDNIHYMSFYENGDFWLNPIYLRLGFFHHFSLKQIEINEIIKYLLEKHLKINISRIL